MGSCTHAIVTRVGSQSRSPRPAGRPVSNQSAWAAPQKRDLGVPMKATNVNGIELAYDVQGEGEPVVFLHGAIWADFLRPLAGQPAFSGFRRIRYHRRGYGESGGPAGGFDVQAADVVALLDHPGVDRAHLGGHS